MKNANTSFLNPNQPAVNPAENKAAKEYVVTFMPEGSIPKAHGTEYAKVGSLTVTLV